MKNAVRSRELGHPHIVVNKAICGGTPIIKGTRISVSNIAAYYLMGLTPEEIQRELPHLNLAQIFDALAFYFDNRNFIDRQIAHDQESVVSKQFPSSK